MSTRSLSGDVCVRVCFSNAPAALKNTLKQMGMRWAAREQCYLMPLPPGMDPAAFEAQIRLALAHPAGASEPALSTPAAHLLQTYQHHLREKQYSRKTSKNYLSAFGQFLRYIAPQLPLEVTKTAATAYLEDLISRKQISKSYQNGIINAIRFYYEEVAGCPREGYDIPRPRRQDPLPRVLTRPEIRGMLTGTPNLKHRCMLMLLYGGGLRLGELLALTIHDIDMRQMVLHIRRERQTPLTSPGPSKGRDVPLPANLLPLLQTYLIQQNPRTYLFEGQTPGEPYSERSLQLVVKQAAARAGIQRPVTAHMLRHSYATHLLEAGSGLGYIREVLGHSNIRSTEIYTHVARAQKPASPLDELGL